MVETTGPLDQEIRTMSTFDRPPHDGIERKHSAPRCEHAPAGACDVPGCPHAAAARHVPPPHTPIVACVVCGKPSSFKASDGRWYCVGKECVKRAPLADHLRVVAHEDASKGRTPSPT